jgi:hypothetical protein
VTVERILKIDSYGGLAAGALALLLRAELSSLERLPVNLLVATALANLFYGSYSGLLAFRAGRGAKPSPASLQTLVWANSVWALVCLVLAWANWADSSWLGKAHLLGEGLYVGALARVEARIFKAA